MYSRAQLAKKYIHYYLTASNGKGHGIHSPFVFDFIINVLNNKVSLKRSGEIEGLRNSLLQDNTSIEVEDFGAGSTIIKDKRIRVIKHIAASSLKPKKYATLLARIANYYNSQTIIELGTSFGISTAYIASYNPSSTIYTLEGSPNIAKIAWQNFHKSGLYNINLVTGNFEHTLPGLLSELAEIDLAFIDGNHRKLPTLQYFSLLLAKCTAHSVLIFDDIHYSKEMEQAWEDIKQHREVSLTIDLFFIGLVFFTRDLKIPRHFVIRF